MKHIINNLDEFEKWINNFLKKLQQQNTASIICLSGEVGVGKTTFTQILGSYLGVDEPITSPTFVIQKEYSIARHDWIQKLIHIDAYRLENKSELEYLGWNEIMKNPNNLIIIEWPEMVEGLNIPQSINIHIEINQDRSRSLKISH